MNVDDELIRAAVACAEVPALLPAVAQLTGDEELLREDLRPDPDRLLEPDAGLGPQQLEEARALACEALREHLASGAAPPAVDADRLRRLLTFVVGSEDVVEEYLPLFREELCAAGEDPRAPGWHKDDLAGPTPFVVAVVGAGMSGLLAAHRCRQAGLDVVVLDKNDDVGGTWLENSYPGCRVDVPNHFYSYSFVQHDWPQYFSTQQVLLDYFRSCAEEFGLADDIRFRTEVTAATYDESRAVWVLSLRTDDGPQTLEANAVISAVGQLNRPSYPDIAGRERFEGPAFHSAEWDHDVELEGRRVAVIGTGASAVQLIPHVAERADELLVFQRTPNWFVPTPEYQQDIPDELRWLQRQVPAYGSWYRFWLFWRNTEGMLAATEVEEAWDDPRSTGALNDVLRELLTAHLQSEFADAPDLIDEVVPAYPPSAKRVIRDDGTWAATLKRDDVRLVTDKISEITPRGVRTADGVEHEVDVIVYGTGFQASRFLTPMRVVGRGGVDLHERWGGDARAYLGINVPGFPNLFCLYGPNTNIVINGSIIYFSECAVSYVVECLRLLLETGHRALEVRDEAHDEYNAWIDEGNRRRVWSVAGVNSWYKNEFGRSAQNWPFSLPEYWRQTRRPDPRAYELS
jgi:4-hydroxyacetophenone monooxygenase